MVVMLLSFFFPNLKAAVDGKNVENRKSFSLITLSTLASEICFDFPQRALFSDISSEIRPEDCLLGLTHN